VTQVKLTDANGNVYTFPQSFFLGPDPVEVRSEVSELIFAHGGVQRGDGFARPRVISVEGELHNDTAAGFETAYRSMMLAVNKGSKLWLSDDTVPRYIEVSHPQVDQEWIHFGNYKRIAIAFDAMFPLWQDTTETATVTVETLDGDMIDRGDCEDVVSPMMAGETVPVLTNVTAARDAAQQYDGSYSFKVTKTVAAGTDATYNFVDAVSAVDLHGFVPGQYYSINVYIWIPTGVVYNSLYFALMDYAGGWVTSTATPVAVYDAWQKVTLTRTIRAAATGAVLRLYFTNTVAINKFVYIDAFHSTPRATLSITGGADHVMMPVVTISADQGVNVPGVLLRNLSDGGSVFEYNNPLFTAGSVLTIDSATGEVRLNGNLATEYFVRGAFPRLQPGVNLIEYEGGAATVTVTFRKVYL
jgi:hypothetical protein